MVDFSQYQPPGTYVEFIPPVQSVQSGTGPSLVALVGPSAGYLTHSETVSLAGVIPVALSKFGIDVTSISVIGADGTIYDTDDFSTVVGAGADGQIGTTGDNTTTIARSAGSTIPDGDPVFVTYRYTDALYYTPQRFTNSDDVIDFFGPPLDLDTNEITSPLSLAALITLAAGAPEVICLSTTGVSSVVTKAQLASAYTKLLTTQEAGIIVPLPVGITGTTETPGDVPGIGTDLRAHILSANGDRFFRTGILGFEHDTTVTPSTGIAATVDDENVRVVWPNVYEYYNSQSRQTLRLSGYYAAAAIAGRASALPVSKAMTQETVRGFAGIPVDVRMSMTNALMNSYSAAGVLVVERDRNGRLVVRHDVTTKVGSIHSRESNLVRARHALTNLLYDNFYSSRLIGSTIDGDTPRRVKSVAEGALERAVAGGIILGYTDLRVRQQTLPSGDPSVMEVKFAYLPAYALNYIVVTYSVNVQTGQASFALAA